MELRPSEFFMALTDEDLIDIAEAGRLYDLCQALTLDLHSQNAKSIEFEA